MVEDKEKRQFEYDLAVVSNSWNETTTIFFSISAIGVTVLFAFFPNFVLSGSRILLIAAIILAVMIGINVRNESLFRRKYGLDPPLKKKEKPDAFLTKINFEGLTNDQLKEYSLLIKDHAQVTFQRKILFLSIVIGICGNIFSTTLDLFLFEILPIYRFKVQMIFGIISLIVIIYFGFSWFNDYQKFNKSFDQYDASAFIEEVERRIQKGKMASDEQS